MLTWTVTKTSTCWPSWMTPPTARSSGTLTATARQAGVLGESVSVGSRMLKSVPAVDDASRFGVIGCCAKIATAVTRPTTVAGSVIAWPRAVVVGIAIVVRSDAATTVRAGMSFAATMTSTVATVSGPRD
jgi:hypothetical protein